MAHKTRRGITRSRQHHGAVIRYRFTVDGEHGRKHTILTNLPASQLSLEQARVLVAARIEVDTSAIEVVEVANDQ